jgi:ATP-dependent Clp protease, protease subunit
MNDGDWTQVLAQRLFEQRVVLLHGPLDEASATRASAELMTLDAEGDAAISLRIDSAGGSLALALTLMDVIELVGVPVRALCMGQVGGPALGVLAVCHHRAAMPSTRFSWREPTTTHMDTRAREVAQWAQLRSDERQRFTDRVAAAIGRPPAVVADTLGAGTFMSAADALEFGLIDEISRPQGEIHQMPGPPIGFRPRR